MDERSTRIKTALGKAELHRVLVRGYDLTEELIGNVSFTGMVSLMLRNRLPTPEETRMLDALLVILIEHGMVSPVVAARFVYANAPEALQAAVAASLLGAGSKHLGSSEWSARMLQEAVTPGADSAALDRAASEVVEQYAARREYIPGIGHSTHSEGDPRANRLLLIARETGCYGTYCELIQRIGLAAEQRRGRRLPVNVTGAIAAIISDLGFDWRIAKAFALIGRTLGALGHLQEEMENPMADRIKDLIIDHVEYLAPERTLNSAQ
jgi:citrate synthase